jgi:Zn-dependent protease with chaperone function
MAAYGLYTHIASNKFRSMLLLAGLFVLVYVMVYAAALIAEVMTDSGRSVDYYLAVASRDLVKDFPLATGAAALWIVIAYFFHQSIVDAVTGGEDVTRQQQPRLYNLLENLCISRGIPMPKLKLIDSDALNAYATGLNQRQYAVTVTSGLLKALNDQEIEAVLGHELTHIRNGDVQLMVIAVIIAGAVGFFAELFFRSFTNFGWGYGRGRSWSSSSSSDRDNRGSGGGAVIVIIIAAALIGAGMAVVAGGAPRAVAVARISGRRRIGRTDQEPRRHDLGAAQDREPRRASRCHLRGDGIVPRQSPRRFFRPVRDPSIGGFPGPGAGEIRRRTRSGASGPAVGHRAGRSTAAAGTRSSPATPAIRPVGQRQRSGRCLERSRSRSIPGTFSRSLGQSCRPLGNVRLGCNAMEPKRRR